MNKWIRILVFLPIPCLMMLTNYIVDPGNLFHDDTEKIVSSLSAGNNVWVLGGNINDREIKRCLILSMPEIVDCIAVGPSLVVGVRASDAETNSFYNLGVTSADYYDILAQFGQMEALGKKYGRVIFCLDSFFFDEQLIRNSTLHERLKPWAIYMLNILENQPAVIPKDGNNKEYLIYAKELLSISYFQNSIGMLRNHGIKACIGERWGIAGNSCSDSFYRPDGSLGRPESQNVQDVVRAANSYDIKKMFSQGHHISDQKKEVFEKLVLYLLEKDVEIDLYLCPVPPTLWERINTKDYFVLDELENFAHQMGEKYDLKITGTYNPYKINMKDKDFYDARHVHRNLLSTYFDFRRKKSDNVSSP